MNIENNKSSNLEYENAALKQINEELRFKEENYIKIIEEQKQELERLRKVAQVLKEHFMKNGPAWQVERCVGCGKCDYILLEDSLVKANVLGK